MTFFPLRTASYKCQNPDLFFFDCQFLFRNSNLFLSIVSLSHNCMLETHNCELTSILTFFPLRIASYEPTIEFCYFFRRFLSSHLFSFYSESYISQFYFFLRFLILHLAILSFSCNCFFLCILSLDLTVLVFFLRFLSLHLVFLSFSPIFFPTVFWVYVLFFFITIQFFSELYFRKKNTSWNLLLGILFIFSSGFYFTSGNSVFY